MPEQRSVVAHFFGGPKDGEMLAVESATSELRYPTVTLGGGQPVVHGELIYVRRGEPLAGHAYYDHDEERSS